MVRVPNRRGADPDAVMASVQEVTGLKHAPEPDTTAHDLLPLDLMADPAKTRAAIAKLGG